jgi:hypothetical protein
MALTDNQLALIKLYMASFNRAPEKGGFDYWSGQLAAGKTFSQVVDIVFSLDVVKAIYPDSMPNDAFLTLIYINIFNKLPDDQGLGFWLSQLGSGRARSSLVLDMINAGLSTPDGTPGKAFILNRYTVAQHAVEQQLEKNKEISIDTLKVIMGSVSESAASVIAANEAIDGDNSGGLRAPTSPLKVAAAANGISPAEKTAGVAVVTTLAGTNAVAGNIVELLINGAPFATPLTRTLTQTDITAGTASLTIPAAASWGGDGDKLLTMRLTDSAGHVGPAGGGITVTLDTTAPGAPTNALAVAAAANSISGAEKTAGVDAVVDLTGTGAAAGDSVEILLGGSPFTVPVTYTLKAADITAKSATVTIPGTAAWGADGSKVLSARVKDATGNTGTAGGSLTVTLDTTPPSGPAITAAAAANGINASEEAAGIAVVASLGGTNAAAGDIVEILIGGVPFSTPVTYTLTAADITAKSATLTITNGAGWGADGAKVLSARVTDAAGNVGTAGKTLSVTLDTVVPSTPGGAITVAAATNGISAAEKTAGVSAVVDLTGSPVIAGDVVELLIDGSPFTTAVTRTLTSGDVSAHSASLTIAGTAGWGADGSKVLSVRIKDGAGNVSAAAGSLTVDLDTTAPGTPTVPMSVAAAIASGLSNAEKNAGVTVTVDLTGTNAVAGETVSLLLGGTAFSPAASTVLTSSDISAGTATVTIPGTAAWGTNGVKTLTARVTDVAGNAGTAGGSLNLTLDATVPGTPTTTLSAAAATNGINAVEKGAGVAVTVSLAGTSAVAGDTVELLIGGSAFFNPVTQTLTSANITAGNVSVIIGSAAGWGADGSKTLTARVTDIAGNVGNAGGSLAVTLDTTAPAVASSSLATYADVNTSSTIDSGDTFVLAFSEATDKAIAIGGLTLTNGHVFGTGATAAWNTAGTQLTVTLGTGATVASGDTIGLVGVADVAGNTAAINFLVP